MASIWQKDIFLTLPNLLGAFLIGFGIMGMVWFVRKLFRRRTPQTTAKEIRIRWIILIVSLFFFAGGWYIHLYIQSGNSRIPLAGLVLGFILGIRALINEHTGRWY